MKISNDVARTISLSGLFFLPLFLVAELWRPGFVSQTWPVAGLFGLLFGTALLVHGGAALSRFWRWVFFVEYSLLSYMILTKIFALMPVILIGAVISSWLLWFELFRLAGKAKLGQDK